MKESLAGRLGLPKRTNLAGEAPEEDKESAVALGSPALPLARRCSTLGALAQLLQRGCRLGHADWLPSSSPL